MFGHGLCAWRYSNSALNPWSAPWMLRIGDRLPSTRSKSNRPIVMQIFGSKMPSAGHSTNDSAVMGLIAAAEALENAEIRSQWVASLLDDASPAVQLLSSGYSAPKPICCGPVGRRWFPESLGSPRPATPPWRRVVLSPPRTVSFIGALVSSFARWAQFALGIDPRRVLCAAGGSAAVWW